MVFMQSRAAHAGMRNPAAFGWLLLAAALVALDWWTKVLASTQLTMFEPVEVFSWLNWRLAHNPGAAFSFLAGAGGWQRWFFTALAVVVSVFIIGWLFRLERGQKLVPLALALLLSGAIGNLVDRLRHGYVVDFIDVHAAGWHWPAFNVADSAITCGIILLLFDAAREAFAGRKSDSGTEAG